MSLPSASPFYPVHEDRVVLETDRCLAFLDRYPLTEGHTLVVPKTMAASLYDLDPDTQAAVWDTVRRARGVLKARYRPDGFNIGLNDGAAAGQTVPHVHVHIIPRRCGDCTDPRGGVRWILPAKAKYWADGAAPPS